MSFCRAFGLALTIAVLGCRSSGIKVSPDAGVADAGFVADLPGVADAFVLADAAATDVQPSFADTSADAAPVSPDLRLASDSIAVVDSAREASPAPSDALDVKLPAAEVSSDGPLEAAPDGLRAPSADGGVAVPALPPDVTVHAAKDFSDADPQCVAATPGWLSLVATFLAEDQKCWADADCMYVSFSDGCGEVCVLPMNRQRIGEFGTHVYDYASSSCTTCPKLPNYPSCAPPTTMVCNAGRCEYKR
jgi:hypothetical protein